MIWAQELEPPQQPTLSGSRGGFLTSSAGTRNAAQRRTVNRLEELTLASGSSIFAQTPTATICPMDRWRRSDLIVDLAWYTRTRVLKRKPEGRPANFFVGGPSSCAWMGLGAVRRWPPSAYA